MRNYVIISPGRDEEQYADRTIRSVASQTELPALWVIVDDGSSDSTPLILARAHERYPWIRVVTLPKRATRILGSGVVHAFDAGLKTLSLDDIDFVSKLDLDVELPPTYFSSLMDEMDRDPRLGTASGRPHILTHRSGPGCIPERGAFEMSAGMAKFYRVTTFREIGGLVPEIMWDAIDCHEARQRGWRSRSFDGEATDFKHLREEGTSDRGVLRGRRRHGFGQWYMGTAVSFMCASAFLRVTDPPFIFGSLNMLVGYFRAGLRRVNRYGDKEFRHNLQRFQRESLVLGKKRAIHRWEGRTVHRWSGRQYNNVAG